MPLYNKYISLLFSVILLSLSLIAINSLIQRALKHPFTNDLTNLHQSFISPSTIIFFTNAFICLFGTLYQCFKQAEFCQNQSQIQQNIKNNILSHRDNYCSNKNNAHNHHIHHLNSQNLTSNTPLDQYDITFNNLPKLQIYKIVLTNFFQLLCFYYGVAMLSFPKVMIFKIISRIGLTPLFQSIFMEDSCKPKILLISFISFVGFSIFNFSFLDSPQIEKDQRLYKDNIIYGYMFVIGMSYLGLIKKIFEKKLYQTYGTWSGDGWILTQTKLNCFLSYLILLVLKQEIYGSVFAVFHSQFMFDIFGLTFLLALVMHLKKYILTKFTAVLEYFIGTLIKILSLITNIILFGLAINYGQILGVFIIAFSAFVYFLLGFREMNESMGNDKEKMPLNRDLQSQKIFTKIDDVKDNDEMKSLKF